MQSSKDAAPEHTLSIRGGRYHVEILAGTMSRTIVLKPERHLDIGWCHAVGREDRGNGALGGVVPVRFRIPSHDSVRRMLESTDEDGEAILSERLVFLHGAPIAVTVELTQGPLRLPTSVLLTLVPPTS